ncbi:hypothetical protein DK26_00810 [Bosea sp. WAO]|nr:hypothetical protein DK26_00810 [Bosea sp. WAO]
MSLAPMTSALAQDATWVGSPLPGGGELSTGTNWTPVGVPSGTGFFGTSTATGLTNAGNTTLGGFTFNAGADVYTITNNNRLIFTGAGIVNNSAQTQSFANPTAGVSVMEFQVAASAGNAVITNGGNLNFRGTATAGSSNITNSNIMHFVDSSTAGNATINNQFDADFYFSSNAGTANITNSGLMIFHDTSSAANATLTVTGAGDLRFEGSSSAGNATITNGHILTFFNNSTAGNAEITNNAGQTVAFRDSSTAGNAVIVNNGGLNFVQNATGGNATLVTNSGGITDFSFSTGPNNDGRLSAGSIAGAGSYVLGTNELTVGGNNSSTLVSGVISGSGSLVKTGTGTLTLSGTNTYAGGTTIAGGAVSIAADANLGAGGALTLNGGVLQVTGTTLTQLSRNVVLGTAGGGFDIADAGNAFAVTQPLSGPGALSKAGAGTLVLSGANVYTGATTVAGGTLRAGAAGAFSAASAVTVASGASLDLAGFNQSIGSLAGAGAVTLGAGTLTTGSDGSSTTFAGAITGTGGLTKAGAGTFTLSGTNGYSGATTVAGGTLRAGAAGALSAASAFTVASGAVLDLAGLNQSIGSLAGAGAVTLGAGTLTTGSDGSSTSFSGAISGTGSLTKAGAGTFTLGGANTYTGATTVAGGTLQAGAVGAFAAGSAFTVGSGAVLDLAGFNQTVASLSGSGTVALGAGTLSTGGDGSSTTFSGAINGTGGLTKTGSGTFSLSGTSGYSGATTIAGGTLVVNGSIANSAVTVGAGILAGTGTVGGIVVAGGGTVAPGNSIGTLNVAGNVAFAPGSVYQLEINAAGQGDRINATGLATLSGGTVQVLAAAGNYAAATSYTILTAAGGVSGQFAGVSSNFAFLTPTLVHGAQDVVLTMTRNDTGFGPDGGGNRPFVAVTRNQGYIANAAERLGVGNPVYDTLVSATAAEARAGFDLLSGEAHAQGVAVAVGESRLVREAVLGRLRGSLLPVAGGEIAAGFSADLPSSKGPVVMPAPRLDERFTLWGEAFGAHANTDGDGNAASLSRRTGGAVVGADMKLYDSGLSSLRVGIAGGYTRSDFDVDARLSSGRLESGHVLIYAGARHGNWRLDGGVGYSFGETNLTRQVRIRGFGDTLRSERDTDVLQAFAELGYAFRFQSFALEPFAQIALLRVSSGSAIEQGGAAALRVASQDQSLGFTTLGLRAEAQLGAMPLFARGLVGWRYGFGDLTPQALTGFVAGTTPARVYAAQIDRNALVAEAGLDWRVSKATTVGIAYSAAIGERTRDHALKGRLEVRF